MLCELNWRFYITTKLLRCVFRKILFIEILQTTHILYSGWPDHITPDDLVTYGGLRRLVLRLYNETPILVHCSAGIGN